MRGILRRCAVALLALTLLLGAVVPAASAMVFGSIDRYAGHALNIREDSSAYITLGKTVRLRMIELADRQIRRLNVRSFKSSRPAVAHVTDNGWVKALAPGKAKITMTARDGRQYALALTVLKTDAPTRIYFSQSSVTAWMGEKVELAPLLCARPLTALLGSNRVIWTTSDTKVALVSSTGVVTPRKPGTATVTATCGKLKATIRVKVRSAED